jgi:hypothetical protein
MLVQKIIQESVNKNPLGIKEALEEELRSRVTKIIEEQKRTSSYKLTVPLENGKIHPDHAHKIDALKKQVKAEDEKEGTKRRVVLQGRMGKNNPHADKYKKGGSESRRGAHAHQRIKLGHAQHADVYVHDRSE